MMKLVYLPQHLKHKSISLYESVFPEDRGEFLNFYYDCIAKRNQILVLVQDESFDKVVGMLHLNPRTLCFGRKQTDIDYIYGVAVLSEYRRKGCMERMMVKALQDMYEQGRAFTYLFPVQKELYEKYGFGYVKVHRPWLENYNIKEALGKLTTDTSFDDFEYTKIELMNEACQDICVQDEKKIQNISERIQNELSQLPVVFQKHTDHYFKEILIRKSMEDGEFLPGTDRLPAMVRILHMEKVADFVKFPKSVCQLFAVYDDMFCQNTGIYKLEEGKMERLHEDSLFAGKLCDRQRGDRNEFEQECKMRNVKLFNMQELSEWLFGMIPFYVWDEV